MSLELTKLTKNFGAGTRNVLDGLNCSLPEAKFISLLGPSGCGKTTLLRILAGLEKPTSGTLRLGSDTLVDTEKKVFVEPEQRNIALVFQNYALWPHMNCLENIAFPLRVRKKPANEIKAQVAQALETVHLPGFEQRMPNSLSGGQQQRIALARALVQHPRLLLLDEPLSNLDASLRDSMRAELRALQQRLQLTAIIVTHDWADARALSDEVVVLNEGHIEQQGSPQEIASQPKSDFVRRLVR